MYSQKRIEHVAGMKQWYRPIEQARAPSFVASHVLYFVLHGIVIMSTLTRMKGDERSRLLQS